MSFVCLFLTENKWQSLFISNSCRMAKPMLFFCVDFSASKVLTSSQNKQKKLFSVGHKTSIHFYWICINFYRSVSEFESGKDVETHHSFPGSFFFFFLRTREPMKINDVTSIQLFIWAWKCSSMVRQQELNASLTQVFDAIWKYLKSYSPAV